MPSGIALTDAFPTTIGLANAPNIAFWEIGVTPPGFDGGDPIPTTTMRQGRWRTFAPKKLITLTPFTFNAAYDPKVIGDINNQMNVNQLVTVTHANGAKWAFWGYLRSFMPGEDTEGNRPIASCTFVPTNQDNTGAEVSPAYTVPPSTTTSTTTTLA